MRVPIYLSVHVLIVEKRQNAHQTQQETTKSRLTLYRICKLFQRQQQQAVLETILYGRRKKKWSGISEVKNLKSTEQVLFLKSINDSVFLQQICPLWREAWPSAGLENNRGGK